MMIGLHPFCINLFCWMHVHSLFEITVSYISFKYILNVKVVILKSYIYFSIFSFITFETYCDMNRVLPHSFLVRKVKKATLKFELVALLGGVK